MLKCQQCVSKAFPIRFLLPMRLGNRNVKHLLWHAFYNFHLLLQTFSFSLPSEIPKCHFIFAFSHFSLPNCYLPLLCSFFLCFSFSFVYFVTGDRCGLNCQKPALSSYKRALKRKTFGITAMEIHLYLFQLGEAHQHTAMPLGTLLDHQRIPFYHLHLNMLN